MTVSNLNLLLWAPFLLVVVLSSIRFVFTGWRKGLWLSLIYLAISLLAGALAIPIVRFLAPAASGRLSPLLLELLPLVLHTQDPLVQSLLQMAGALLLYPLIFFLLALVSRLVIGALVKPLLADSEKRRRLGGLITGTAHALIYPILLLLPLYGTLAAFMPTAQAFLSFAPEEETQASAYVEVMAEHPVVKLCATAPVQWYYRGLSSVELDGASLDLANAAKGAREVLDELQRLRGADPEKQAGMLPDLIQVLDSGVLDTTWCYRLVCDIGVDKLFEAQDIPVLGQWLASLKGISRQDYRQTVDSLITLTEQLQETEKLPTLLSGEDILELLQDPQITAPLDTFLESTPQTRELKTILLVYCTSQLLFDGDGISARTFVTAILANPDTKALLTLDTLGSIAGAESPAAAVWYILNHDEIHLPTLLTVLKENDLLGKLHPDFATAFQAPG